MKKAALLEPERQLWNNGSKELKAIFEHLNALKFEDVPNYAFIKEQLILMLRTELQQEDRLTVAVELGKKRPPAEPSINSNKTQASEESKMMPPDPKRQKVAANSELQ
jgi:hypothetical protein